MACSLSAVAEAAGEIPKRVEEGAKGFRVPSEDAEALGRRLRQVIEEPAARLTSARRREKAKRELPSDRYFRGYGELFARLAPG